MSSHALQSQRKRCCPGAARLHSPLQLSGLTLILHSCTLESSVSLYWSLISPVGSHSSSWEKISLPLALLFLQSLSYYFLPILFNLPLELLAPQAPFFSFSIPSFHPYHWFLSPPLNQSYFKGHQHPSNS